MIDQISMNLEELEQKRTHQTMRTVPRAMGSAWCTWTGLWPVLRELFQNTQDHLSLFKDGRLHPAVTLHAVTPYPSPSFVFRCGSEPVCSVTAAPDELRIEQYFTFPIHPRALETGIDDKAKRRGTLTAGGFGDGFKSAAITLLAAGGSLRWRFETRGQIVQWDFKRHRKDAVAGFRAADLLEIEISRAAAPPGGGGGLPRNNWMEQVVAAPGVGDAFMEAARRLQVFWRVDDASLLRHPAGGDFLCAAAEQPPIVGQAGRPEPGVYVHGIWVCPDGLQDAIMSFAGGRLDVTGRERNHVENSALVTATFNILRGQLPAMMPRLRALLAKLLGESDDGATPPDTWLTRPPAFLNQLLGKDPEWFRTAIFGFAPGTLFISKLTTESNDPLVRWLSEYLATKNAPLRPLGAGRHPILFQEGSEAQLKARAVEELAREPAPADQATKRRLAAADAAALKLLRFCDLARRGRQSPGFRVVFKVAVQVEFMHGNGDLYLPLAPLTAKLMKNMLLICQRHVGFDESAEAIKIAFHELEKDGEIGREGAAEGEVGELGPADIDKVLARARELAEEYRNALVRRPPPAAAAAVGRGTVDDPMRLDEEEGKGDDGAHQPEPHGAVRSLLGAAGKAVGGLAAGAKNAVVSGLRSMSGANDAGGDGGGNGGNGGGTLDAQIERLLAAELPALSAELKRSALAKDSPGNEPCIWHSTLKRHAVGGDLGGGEMMSDGTLDTLEPASCTRLRALRDFAAEARSAVAVASPALAPIITDRVVDGYDADGQYRGFCNSDGLVVLNLAAFLDYPDAEHTLPHALVHTLTHELAHLLESGDGHGSRWREAHAQLLQRVYADVCASATAGGGAACGCARCPGAARRFVPGAG